MSNGGHNRGGSGHRHQSKNHGKSNWKGKGGGNRGGGGNGGRVHAPYNFVPLSNVVFPADNANVINQDMPLKDGYSGTIAFRIIAESPLCVGGERTKASSAAPGQVYMFKTPDGSQSYAIPGSSIRGMIRNVLEIATFSKFDLVDEQRFAVRDLSGSIPEYGRKMVKKDRHRGLQALKPKALAGLLRYDRDLKVWKIRPQSFGRIEQEDLAEFAGRIINREKPDREAERVLLTRDSIQAKPARDAKGKPVFLETVDKYRLWEKHSLSLKLPVKERIKPDWHLHAKGSRYLWYERITIADNANGGHGLLVFTGQPSATKHMEFVFFDDGSEEFEVPPNLMSRFVAAQKAAAGRGDTETSTWDFMLRRMNAAKDEPIPVFFLPKDAASPRSIEDLGLSMMFPMTTAKSVSEIVDVMQCGSQSVKLDWAQAIFGMAAEEKGEGLKGRVSFSVARIQGDQHEVTLSRPGILSSPKASFYPAYLEQPDADGGGKVTNGSCQVMHYLSEDVRLRGWKRYPARSGGSAVQKMDGGLTSKRQLQTQLNTLPKGAQFSGQLRFHNLTAAELGAMLWCMTLGGNSHLVHGLGTGKPWGFGQSRVEIVRDGASIIPNDLEEPRTSAWRPFVDDFVKRMEQLFAERTDVAEAKWGSSPQIAALQAMADPAKAPNGNSPAGLLRHMSLEDKDFQNAKRHNPAKQSHAAVLKPYKK